jgi:uncharacterized membrane-anchored protein YitT (DUF2179 family)
MWRTLIKAKRGLWLSRVALLAVFVLISLGCDGNMMPSLSATHGSNAECKGVMTMTFDAFSKQEGAWMLLVALVIFSWKIFEKKVTVNVTLVQLFWVKYLLRTHNRWLRWRDHVLQALAGGILHPKIY